MTQGSQTGARDNLEWGWDERRERGSEGREPMSTYG